MAACAFAAAAGTYAYDNNGNLTGTAGAATSSFMWDYRNRMIAAWVSGATTTYAYDHTIQRIAQITPTTTTHCPSKFYAGRGKPEALRRQGPPRTSGTRPRIIGFHLMTYRATARKI